jgi:protein tyrosine/serine phosphatase
VLVHCGGGMHRTGMVVGVIQRCINGVGPELIERQYKLHTAYRSADETGGFEKENVEFVQRFDCSLLSKP